MPTFLTSKILLLAGFVCHNIHNCPNANMVKALSLFCESCVSLSVVLAAAESGAGLDVDIVDGEDGGEGEDKGGGEEELEDEQGIEEAKSGSPKRGQANSRRKNKKRANRYPFVKSLRYLGTTAYWNSRKGWGFVKVDEEGGGKVFVHNLALPSASKFRFLNVGERVEFNVKLGEKGPFAENVSGAGSEGLRCEGTRAKESPALKAKKK